jgi:hypothetical protein
VSGDERLTTEEPALAKKLQDLRRKFIAAEAFPDVVAVWEAIRVITNLNSKLSKQGRVPHPLPGWINDYLLQSANKIGRLSLGIRPEDERPLASMNFNEVGELRAVCQTDRVRDTRTHHVASALGFVRKGESAFQRHDRIERDANYLRIHDDPSLQDDRPRQREAQQILLRVMMKNEHLGTEQSARNRLSKARAARGSRTPRK